MTSLLGVGTIEPMSKKNDSKINYDREADVLAVYLKKGLEEEFVEIAHNINVELNKKGDIIGIEILEASKTLKPFIRGLSLHPASL